MKAKRVAFLGIAVALALVLSFIEYQLAFFIPIYGAYGIKIGLANVVTVFLLYKLSLPETAAVSVIRVAIASLLFGSFQSFTFGFVGAIVSLLGMWAMKRFAGFSLITVSVSGGILHNLGQIAVAVAWTQTSELILNLPVLLITGVAAGAVIGLVASLVLKRLEGFKFNT